MGSAFHLTNATYLVRDHKTRLCLPSNDQIAKIAVVVLHIALTGGK